MARGTETIVHGYVAATLRMAGSITARACRLCRDRTAAAIPALSGRDIVSQVPGLRKTARLTLEDYARLPGPHVNPYWMWGLKQRIEHHLDLLA